MFTHIQKMQNSLCLVHLVAGTAVSDCIVCDFMYMMMCRMIMASFTCIEAFWNLGYVTNTCCVMQTRLDYDNHHVLFLFVIFVVYVVVADQLLRLRISQQTSSVSFMYQMSDLCRNNKLCYKCVFFSFIILLWKSLFVTCNLSVHRNSLQWSLNCATG